MDVQVGGDDRHYRLCGGRAPSHAGHLGRSWGKATQAEASSDHPWGHEGGVTRRGSGDSAGGSVRIGAEGGCTIGPMGYQHGLVVFGVGVNVVALVLGIVLVVIPAWAAIVGGAGGGVLILVGLILMARGGRSADRGGERVEQNASPNAQQASGVGGDVYQAGRDITVRPGGGAQLPWLKRPGGPKFRLSPGVHDGKVLCTFHIRGASEPGEVRARWTGAGTDMDWRSPMPQNVPPGRTEWGYQMKPVAMSPTPPADIVTFEVQFWLEDGEHGGRWHWPLEQHEKGHWLMEAQKGSGVQQPPEEDTW